MCFGCIDPSHSTLCFDVTFSETLHPCLPTTKASFLSYAISRRNIFLKKKNELFVNPRIKGRKDSCLGGNLMYESIVIYSLAAELHRLK